MSKRILETVHETAKGLHDAGLMEVTTMHEFDAHKKAENANIHFLHPTVYVSTQCAMNENP